MTAIRVLLSAGRFALRGGEINLCLFTYACGVPGVSSPVRWSREFDNERGVRLPGPGRRGGWLDGLMVALVSWVGSLRVAAGFACQPPHALGHRSSRGEDCAAAMPGDLDGRPA